ncbi:MAG: thioredoxin-related protein [Parasphingorhabdus sp.]|jgi:thioredoxin-related protein
MVNNIFSRFTPGIMLIVAMWIFSPAGFAEAPDGWNFLPFDQARKASIENQQPLLLYFGRFGCPTCARVNHESFTDQRVVAQLKKNYVLAYVDSESGRRLRLSSGERITEMGLAIRYQIKGTPTFFFLEPDGTVILSIPGYVSADQFLGLDLFVNGGYYRVQSLQEFAAGKS